MKQKLLIADCIGKYDLNGLPLGHYINFSRQYYQALKDDFEVTLAVSELYQKYLGECDSFLTIKRSLLYKKNNKKGDAFKRLFRELFNVIDVLKYDCDTVIFQASTFFVLIFALAFYFGKKKIYVIVYRDYLSSPYLIINVIKKLLYKVAKHKLNGIIATIPAVAEKYKVRSIVLPDYFCSKIIEGQVEEFKYDAVVLGINTESKDIKTVVDAFRNTKYKVLIAGRFTDEKQFKEVDILKSDNIAIWNEYLEEGVYKNILTSTKTVVLPYKPEEYTLQSSGVFFEALYNLKPVIASKAAFFDVVEMFNLGFRYKKSPQECFALLENREEYQKCVENIRNYVNKLNFNVSKKLVSFINNCNSELWQ